MGWVDGVIPFRWSSSMYLYGPEYNSSAKLALQLFLLMARPPWDFSQLPQFFNLTSLPPSLGLLESWLNRVSRSIRSECEIGDCSNGVCEHDPVRFMRPTLSASFCLQPPGDTTTRRSTFDAVLAGCIPVFFEELSAKAQYGWHLPEAEFEELSVFIPKEEVVFRGMRILDVLQRIPRGRVRRMRERVLELMPSVLYRKHNSSPGLKTKKDAVDLAIDGTLDKIRSRLRDIHLDFVM